MDWQLVRKNKLKHTHPGINPSGECVYFWGAIGEWGLHDDFSRYQDANVVVKDELAVRVQGSGKSGHRDPCWITNDTVFILVLLIGSVIQCSCGIERIAFFSPYMGSHRTNLQLEGVPIRRHKSQMDTRISIFLGGLDIVLDPKWTEPLDRVKIGLGGMDHFPVGIGFLVKCSGNRGTFAQGKSIGDKMCADLVQVLVAEANQFLFSKVSI